MPLPFSLLSPAFKPASQDRKICRVSANTRRPSDRYDLAAMKTIVLILAAAALSARGAFAEDPGADAALIERGKKIAAAAFAKLSEELAKALADGSPSHALPFCHVNVPKIMAEVSEQQVASVQRLTHKPRNPKNRVSEAEQKIIDGFATARTAGETPKPVLLTDPAGRKVFYSPIYVTMATCLQCHGEPGKDISEANLKLIRSLFPEDLATGFKLGDLRGMWKITFLQ